MHVQSPRRLQVLVLVLAGSLLATTCACQTAGSAEEERPPPRWWFGIQAGLSDALAAPDPTRGSGGAHLFGGIEGGVRIAPDLRLGLLLDQGSLGKADCPADDLLCRWRKQDIAHQYLTLEFNPGRGRWLCSVSAGRAVYDLNQNFFDDGDFLVDDASGWGVRVGVGQDWHRRGARTHIGWRTSLEHANPGKLADGLGSAHTSINLSLRLSWY